VNRRGQIEFADDRCVIVLLPSPRAGGGVGWKAVAFRDSPSGSQSASAAGSESLTILGERTLATPTEDLRTWVSSWKPSRAFVVLPPSATMCRTCPLPPVKGEQLDSALRLQAETALLGGVPTHRVGMVALPEPSGSTARQGVIVAWPESSGTPPLPTLPDYTEVRFAPTVACLLALLRGLPPTQPLVRADREDGSILLLLASVGSGSNLLLRSTREDIDDDATWRNGILRAATETLLSADGSPDDIKELHRELEEHLRSDSFLALPAAAKDLVQRRFPSGTLSAGERAVALGALLAAGGPLAPLVSLRASLPRPKPMRLEAALRRLQSPRTAATVIIASLAIFVFAPLLFAGVRYGILRMKLSDLESYERENRQTRQKAALYTTLARTTWPMTKLLGDLSNAVPETIDIESIHIRAGGNIIIRGIAKGSGTLSAQEVVSEFETRARNTGVFSDVVISVDAMDGRNFSAFSFTCTASNPTRIVAWKQADDYAVLDLKDRRYPKWREIEDPVGTAGAKNTDEPSEPVETALADASAARATPPDAGASRRDGGRGNDRAVARGAEADGTSEAPDDGKAEETPDESSATTGPASDRGINRRRPAQPEGADGTVKPAQPQPTGPVVEIPPPISDDVIAGLNKQQASDLLSQIAKARQQPDLDAETQERLKADLYRVLARLKTAP